MVVLDVTASHRTMWKTKSPPLTIFLDLEPLCKPDVIADNRFLPFRLNSFQCIIFDPPFGVNLPPWFLEKTRWNSYIWYGNFRTKRELLRYIHDAQEEFKRFSPRMCLKWGERNIKLDHILPFFLKNWEIIQVISHNSLHHLSSKNNQKSRTKTFWVTFIRKQN